MKFPGNQLTSRDVRRVFLLAIITAGPTDALQLDFDPGFSAAKTKQIEKAMKPLWKKWSHDFALPDKNPRIRIHVLETTGGLRYFGAWQLQKEMSFSPYLPKETLNYVLARDLASIFFGDHCPQVAQDSLLLNEAFALWISGGAKKIISDSPEFLFYKEAQEYIERKAYGDRDKLQMSVARVLTEPSKKNVWPIFFKDLITNCQQNPLSVLASEEAFRDLLGFHDGKLKAIDALYMDGLSKQILAAQGSPGPFATGNILTPLLGASGPEKVSTVYQALGLGPAPRSMVETIGFSSTATLTLEALVRVYDYLAIRHPEILAPLANPSLELAHLPQWEWFRSKKITLATSIRAGESWVVAVGPVKEGNPIFVLAMHSKGWSLRAQLEKLRLTLEPNSLRAAEIKLPERFARAELRCEGGGELLARDVNQGWKFIGRSKSGLSGTEEIVCPGSVILGTDGIARKYSGKLVARGIDNPVLLTSESHYLAKTLASEFGDGRKEALKALAFVLRHNARMGRYKCELSNCPVTMPIAVGAAPANAVETTADLSDNLEGFLPYQKGKAELQPSLDLIEANRMAGDGLPAKKIIEKFFSR